MHAFDSTKPIQVCVDADFSGTWNLSESDLLTSALSRTGYVIKISNCPMQWVSKLQTEVVLSRTESECVALSQSTRDLIPIKEMIEHHNSFIKIDSKQLAHVQLSLKTTTEPCN